MLANQNRLCSRGISNKPDACRLEQYLDAAVGLARAWWADFDIPKMTAGMAVLTAGAILHAIFIWCLVTSPFPGPSGLGRSQIAQSGIGCCSYKPAQAELAGVQTGPNPSVGGHSSSPHFWGTSGLATVCMLLHSFSLFSDSFIMAEGRIVTFFLTTLTVSLAHLALADLLIALSPSSGPCYSPQLQVACRRQAARVTCLTAVMLMCTAASANLGLLPRSSEDAMQRAAAGAGSGGAHISVLLSSGSCRAQLAAELAFVFAPAILTAFVLMRACRLHTQPGMSSSIGRCTIAQSIHGKQCIVVKGQLWMQLLRVARVFGQLAHVAVIAFCMAESSTLQQLWPWHGEMAFMQTWDTASSMLGCPSTSKFCACMQVSTDFAGTLVSHIYKSGGLHIIMARLTFAFALLGILTLSLGLVARMQGPCPILSGPFCSVPGLTAAAFASSASECSEGSLVALPLCLRQTAHALRGMRHKLACNASSSDGQSGYESKDSCSGQTIPDGIGWTAFTEAQPLSCGISAHLIFILAAPFMLIIGRRGMLFIFFSMLQHWCLLCLLRSLQAHACAAIGALEYEHSSSRHIVTSTALNLTGTIIWAFLPVHLFFCTGHLSEFAGLHYTAGRHPHCTSQ